MCKAFSCLVTRGNKVYWKRGIDSHEDLINLFQKGDCNLNDDKVPPLNTFARIEITPPKGNYLDTNFAKWKFDIDELIKPSFLEKKHEDLCRIEMAKWAKEVQSFFNMEEIQNPIHPFSIVPPTKITKKHLALLKQWDSVRASVRASVWDSVRASVRDSVRDSVWDSVRDSVWDSVWDSVRDSVWDFVRDSVRDSVWDSARDSVRASVWAYTGTIFKGIEEWKYIDYSNPIFQKGEYPFQSVVKLWKMGLVPSFDGKTWRLHGGPKAEILWEGKL